MTGPIPVADVDDPRLDDYRRLTDPSSRRRVEARGRFLVAESEPVVRRALQAGLRIRSLVVTRRRLAKMEDVVAALDAPVFLVEQDVLDAVCGFRLHRGVVAAVDRPPDRQPESLLTGARALALLEGIGDHENLGAVFRSAGALGIDAVLLDPTCADPWYRRSVRVSMGAVFTVPWARWAPWPGFDRLAEAGFLVLALTPEGEVPIDELRVGDRRPAVLLGREGPGISAEGRAAAHLTVCIPMRPGYDSLNVGHAAAVAFHRITTAKE